MAAGWASLSNRSPWRHRPCCNRPGLEWAADAVLRAPRSGLECVSFDGFESDWGAAASANPGEITGTKAIRRGQHGLDGRKSKEKGETVHQYYSDSSQGGVHAVFSLPSRMSPERSLRGESLDMLQTVRRAGRRPRSQLQHEDSEGLRAQKTGVIFDELDDLLACISTLAQTQTSTATGGSG